jgi:hypothetical protein
VLALAATPGAAAYGFAVLLRRGLCSGSINWRLAEAVALRHPSGAGACSGFGTFRLGINRFLPCDVPNQYNCEYDDQESNYCCYVVDHCFILIHTRFWHAVFRAKFPATLARTP